MSIDFGTDNSNRSRIFLPAKHVLIQDIQEGAWDDVSNNLQTRYGTVQRVFLLGTITDKKEIVQESADESFIADDKKSKSRVNLTIDDGTGDISGTIWGNPTDVKDINKGDLTFCGGSVRNYKNRIFMTINIIRKIQDPNEECYHILKILHKRQTIPRVEIQKAENPILDGFNGNASTESENEQIPESNKNNKEKTQQIQEIHQTFVEELESTASTNDQEAMNTKVEEVPIPQPPKKKKFKKDDANSEKPIESSPINEMDLESSIIEFIESHDSGDGTPSKEIAKEYKLVDIKLKQILDQLTQRIKIYKVKPGFYAIYKDN